MTDKVEPLNGLMFYPNFLAGDRERSSDTLWLRLSPKTYIPNSWSRGSAAVPEKGVNSSYKTEDTMYFLMPADFAVGLNHEWDELDDTIASKIRDVNKELQVGAAQLSDLTAAAIGKGGGWGSLSVKNDSPLIYKNTQRLEFQLNFEFYSPTNPKEDVWAPIDQLMKLSSPVRQAGGAMSVNFTFPYIFDISTVTGDGRVIDMIYNDCAITSLMPTYYSPYLNGYPQKATVDITFRSIYNTYRNSFNRGGIISVGEKSE